MHTTRNAISISINRSSWNIGARSITVTNHIGLIDLWFKLQMQVICTLRPPTIAASTDCRVVLIVTARSNTQIVNPFAQRGANARVFTKVIIIDLDAGQTTTTKPQRRECPQININDVGGRITDRNRGPKNGTCERVVIDRINKITRLHLGYIRSQSWKIDKNPIGNIYAGSILCAEYSDFCVAHPTIRLHKRNPRAVALSATQQ